MVGNFCNRTACRIRNRRRRHDNNMTLRKKRTPRASQHYTGWRAGQKSLLLPVAGEVFLLTLPFIERGIRPCGYRDEPFRFRMPAQPVDATPSGIKLFSKVVFMKQGRRFGFSEEQKLNVWRR